MDRNCKKQNVGIIIKSVCARPDKNKKDIHQKNIEDGKIP